MPILTPLLSHSLALFEAILKVQVYFSFSLHLGLFLLHMSIEERRQHLV